MVPKSDGPGRGGSYLPPLPQIQTCGFPASGSSRHGFASRHAICRRYGDRESGFKVPGLVPTDSSATRQPLPSAGSARLAFPCFAGTMGCSDFRRTGRPRFVCASLGRTLARASVFAPHRPDADRGPGALTGGCPSEASGCGRESPDLPSSWGASTCLCRVLRPRRDQRHQATAVRWRGPRADKTEGSPRVGLSGLNSTA